MSYVVYDTKTTVIKKHFELESAAKRSTTCMNRKAVKQAVDRALTGNKTDVDVYAYKELNDYNQNVVYMKTVKNLITGKDIQIPSNTPHCCDPSTETYWSM